MAWLFVGAIAAATHPAFAPGPMLFAGWSWLLASSCADTVIVSVATITSGREPNTRVAAPIVTVVPITAHASGCCSLPQCTVVQSDVPGLVLIELPGIAAVLGVGTHTSHAPVARHAVGPSPAASAAEPASIWVALGPNEQPASTIATSAARTIAASPSAS